MWHRSSRSGGEGNCVEVAASAATAGAPSSAVVVRDSKDPGPALSFGSAAWARFVAAVPAGERDHQL
ncbi:DUF397 domain-containing protein [Salinispora sp. H7-4]|uniref:DUF397 domain-containing protein n=1 Tax=Salinispora sp. H7-4 TaxID=2748321 RepID=UPI0015D3C998|nr:DUF397 domain-containing protein [Salinispora sp. H7-4]NYT93828.1 DUF397 domain-containing protein [Salinispora sp. H7-4]